MSDATGLAIDHITINAAKLLSFSIYPGSFTSFRACPEHRHSMG